MSGSRASKIAQFAGLTTIKFMSCSSQVCASQRPAVLFLMWSYLVKDAALQKAETRGGHKSNTAIRDSGKL